MAGSAVAAAQLRARRLAAGLSQEQLAERCRVSERTIRTLESGTAKRPHRDTLNAVAEALSLDAGQAAAFVALWHAAARSVGDAFQTYDEQMFRSEFTAIRGQIRDRIVHLVVDVDAQGRYRRYRTRRTFEAVVDGVDTFAWTVGLSSEQAMEALTLVDWVNLEPVSSVPLADAPATMFVASLGRPLRAGELYSVFYGFEIDGHDTDPATLDVESLFSVLAPMDALEIEIRFDPAALPRRAWQVRQPTVDVVAAPVGELPVSPFGIAQLAELPASAGVHGIRWEWDR